MISGIVNNRYTIVTVVSLKNMVAISKIGRFLRTDDEGFVVNDASLEKIITPWKNIVVETVEALLINFGDIIHSIYLRGSAATGHAIRGISDVDFIAVVSTQEETLERSWEEAFVKKMRTKYTFCSGVDIRYIKYENIISSDFSHHAYARMLLKTQSICVHGESLENLIGGYKPGYDMIVLSPFIKDDIAKSAEALRFNTSLDADDVKRTCQSIARKIIRVGFEIVMVNEKIYTRDLYLCFEAFSKNFPSQKKNMENILQIALDSNPDRQEVLQLLTDFGDWIIYKISMDKSC